MSDFKKTRAKLSGLDQIQAVSDYTKGIEMLRSLQEYSKSASKFDVGDIIQDHQLGTPLVYPPQKKKEN